MDTAQQIIFGESGFPRTVAKGSGGDFSQFFVHSEGEFDLFFDHNRPDQNLYSSICRFRSDMRHITGDVAFDFDAPLKDSVFDTNSDREKVERMREDEELAEKVLGQVWKDTQSLVRFCKTHSMPVVSVFSGLGVHCHVLHQEETEPVKKKISTSNWIVDECDLSTHDRQIIPDTRRVLRIPNSQRIDNEKSTGVWCIPITEDEVLNNSIHDLLERCASPKEMPYHERYRSENRPEMELKEGYEDPDVEEARSVELEPRSVDQEISDLTEWIIRNTIPLPCVAERVLSANPHHMVRFNAAVFLLQGGYKPSEVIEILGNIGWVDYDKGITTKMVKSIYNNRYSEMPCNKLYSLGLCVYSEEIDEYSNDESDCETYKYTSGEALYPYE
jgi:hypothetical protein